MRRYGGQLALSLLFGAELLDELVYGTQGAVLPQLKGELDLSYTQVGLLFTVPALVGLLTEPLMGLLGDTRYRRWLILGGLGATTCGLLLTAVGSSFLLLISFSTLHVASGAYVNLAQATLIDRDLTQSEQTMARWTLLGSVGVTVAPLVVTGLAWLGLGWRGLYLGLAGSGGIYTLFLLRIRMRVPTEGTKEFSSLRVFLGNLSAALRSRELLRWILLTQLADLMVDRLFEVVGLYFNDVAGVGPAVASGAVAAFSIAGLIGNGLLLPALNRLDSYRLLRVTAVVAGLGYAALLLVPTVWVKFLFLIVVSLVTASWFPILRALCYKALPGQSGLVVAVTSLDNVSTLLVPLLLGRVADLFGLEWAMWLLILGPLALWAGVPRRH